MIKARATLADGRPLYALGLSDGNLQRLREGKPIFFDMADMGSTGKMLIFWGATEAEMYEWFKDHLPETTPGGPAHG